MNNITGITAYLKYAEDGTTASIILYVDYENGHGVYSHVLDGAHLNKWMPQDIAEYIKSSNDADRTTIDTAYGFSLKFEYH